MKGLEKRIKTYAFVHNCDLDKASFDVLREILKETADRRTTEGLYDNLVGEEGTSDKCGQDSADV